MNRSCEGPKGGPSQLLDALYPWPMPLLWPFSPRLMGLDVLGWGDPAVLAIVLAAMFGLGVFRRRTRLVAVSSIAVLATYAGFGSLVA